MIVSTPDLCLLPYFYKFMIKITDLETSHHKLYFYFMNKGIMMNFGDENHY